MTKDNTTLREQKTHCSILQWLSIPPLLPKCIILLLKGNILQSAILNQTTEAYTAFPSAKSYINCYP